MTGILKVQIEQRHRMTQVMQQSGRENRMVLAVSSSVIQCLHGKVRPVCQRSLKLTHLGSK